MYHYQLISTTWRHWSGISRFRIFVTVRKNIPLDTIVDILCSMLIDNIHSGPICGFDFSNKNHPPFRWYPTTQGHFKKCEMECLRVHIHGVERSPITSPSFHWRGVWPTVWVPNSKMSSLHVSCVQKPPSLPIKIPKFLSEVQYLDSTALPHHISSFS